jgi:Sec-independent protein translocase protein TatA
MGDVAKGIKSFKKGMTDEDAPDTAKTVDHKQLVLQLRAMMMERTTRNHHQHLCLSLLNSLLGLSTELG